MFNYSEDFTYYYNYNQHVTHARLRHRRRSKKLVCVDDLLARSFMVLEFFLIHLQNRGTIVPVSMLHLTL